MSDFATYEDVESAWRPLSDEERTRASYLIGRASRKIRGRWTDVDARIATGTLDADAVADVVAEMVQSAMVAPPGAEQFSSTAGPFSETVRYANPSGRLYFTDDMLRVFEPARSHQGWAI